MPINNKWNLGFELEFAFYGLDEGFTKNLRRFKSQIKSIHPDIKIGEDWSIDMNYGRLPHGLSNYVHSPLEVKTPAIYSRDSLSILEKCFTAMSESTVQTNATCGLHANFSPESDAVYDRVNLFRVQSHPYWRTIAKAFRRENNYYCKVINDKSPIIKTCESGRLLTANQVYKLIWYLNSLGDGGKRKPLDEYGIPVIQNAVSREKYQAVSLRNWELVRKPESRIELRMFGNKGYEKDFPKVKKYIAGSIEALDRCLD